MSIIDSYNEYVEARERFIKAHGLVRDYFNDLKANLQALREAQVQADRTRGPLVLAQQKLNQALHADVSGVLGTPPPPELPMVVSEANSKLLQVPVE
jgi:hypothetical protein